MAQNYRIPESHRPFRPLHWMKVIVGLHWPDWISGYEYGNTWGKDLQIEAVALTRAWKLIVSWVNWSSSSNLCIQPVSYRHNF